MQVIHCTGKLLREMGLSKARLPNQKAADGTLGAWHANLIHVDKRKTILFVNDKTLFNFIAPDVSRAQIKDLGELFRNYLSCVISEEGFDGKEKDRVLAEYADITYSGATNRSVLGSMNDLAFNYKYFVLRDGGIH